MDIITETVAQWARTFPEPVKPREALYVIQQDPKFIAALDQVVHGFAGSTNQQPDLVLWLNLIDNRPFNTPDGIVRIRRAGHHWEVFREEVAVAA